jgi:isopentenyl-diphosphate delta-isomerase
MVNNDADDLVVLVDDDDRVVGTALKSETHHADTPLHRGFSVFLFNRQGEFLMQQRAFSKKTWAGVWSNSCCGHPMLGETVTAAAMRRIEYELGLTGIDLEIALPDFRYRAEKDGVVENELCPVLIGLSDEEPVPNPSEVERIKWVNWDGFVASLDDPATDISPWAAEEGRLLCGSEIFNRMMDDIAVRRE